MTETFNVFDEPNPRPTEHPVRWDGQDICNIQEPHESHNWTINYLFHGAVEYACPGIGIGSMGIATKEDISDDRDAFGES